MSMQFDYALWRLKEHGDRKHMEKLLHQLENETKIGQQIKACRRLLDDSKAAPQSEAQS